MNSSEPVQDDEELYRNVRGKLEDKEYSIQDGELVIFRNLRFSLKQTLTVSLYSI